MPCRTASSTSVTRGEAVTQTRILLQSGTNELEVVEFFLTERVSTSTTPYTGYYGVNVAKVREIIRLPKVTEIPEATDPSILGAFNQRSRIISLVDLCTWLGKERVEEAPPKVVVTEFNQVTTAFLVSGVTRIHRVSWEDVAPPSSYLSSFSQDCITGVINLRDRIVFLLDLERIVADLNPRLALRYDESIDWQGARQYRALLADDSKLVRTMLKEIMEKSGFQVETYTNGRDAWNRLKEIKSKAAGEGKTLQDYIQVVVSDIEMPGMDGHHFTKRIKDDPELRRLPVILFSSLISDELRHKGEAVGADEQLAKPEAGLIPTRARELIQERLL